MSTIVRFALFIVISISAVSLVGAQDIPAATPNADGTITFPEGCVVTQTINGETGPTYAVSCDVVDTTPEVVPEIDPMYHGLEGRGKYYQIHLVEGSVFSSIDGQTSLPEGDYMFYLHEACEFADSDWVYGVLYYDNRAGITGNLVGVNVQGQLCHKGHEIPQEDMGVYDVTFDRPATFYSAWEQDRFVTLEPGYVYQIQIARDYCFRDIAETVMVSVTQITPERVELRSGWIRQDELYHAGINNPECG